MRKTLFRLDTKKAKIDQAPVKLLKSGEEVLSVTLTYLIYLSANLSSFPEECKVATFKSFIPEKIGCLGVQVSLIG